MKANCLILSNSAEMQKADEMNLPCQPIYKKVDLLFDINEVDWATLDADGNIELFVKMTMFTIEFNNDIWSKLKIRFNA